MQGMIPKPGYEFNPILRTVGRNDPCVCGSDRKFKACHQRDFLPVITQEQAEQARQELRQLGYKPPMMQGQNL